MVMALLVAVKRGAARGAKITARALVRLVSRVRVDVVSQAFLVAADKVAVRAVLQAAVANVQVNLPVPPKI
jgi:hypothetical protein